MSNENEKPQVQLLQIAPLFPIGLSLVGGIVLDRTATPPGLLYLVPLAVATAATLATPIRHRLGPICVLVAAIAAGGLLHFSSARVIHADSVEQYATESGGLARVRGRVVGEPRLLQPPPTPFAWWAHRTRRTGFVLAVDSIAGEGSAIPATGYVRVTLFEPVLDLGEGDDIEVFGRLYALRPRDNPGSFDWEKYYRSQGIVARINCKHREAIRRMSGSDTVSAPGIITTVRRRLLRLLVDTTTDDETGASGLLEGMVLGQRSKVSRLLNDLFIRAGCVHFLAVSGVHLVIVMLLARTFARLLGATGRIRVLAMMAAIVFYAVVAEPRPPILRASIIGMIYCVACLLHRQRSRLNWISACVVVLAIVRPNMIFDVGYQLSTTAVIGVGFLAPALRPFIARLFHGDANSMQPSNMAAPASAFLRVVRHTKWKLVQGISISLAAWLAALPIVATIFFRVHPWGMLSSLVLLPLVTLVMALGFAKMIVAAISPTAGAALAGVLNSLSAALVGGVDWLGQLPGASVTVIKPPLPLVVLYYLTLILFVLASQERRPQDIGEDPDAKKGRDTLSIVPRWTPKAACAFLGIGFIVWWYPAGNSGRLTITALSVGRGSATVIQLPTGETFLYDAGSSYASDPGTSTITPFLLTRGITSVDRVFVSHPNLDHFSGLPAVARSITTGPVVINHLFKKRSRPRAPSRKLLKILTDLDHPIETLEAAPATWKYEDVTIEYLWPTEKVDDAYTTNDTSTVLRITYAGKSVILTGDIERAAQRSLLERGEMSADVLFLPHHGGVVGTTQEFVAAVNPQVLIRSSSERMSETISNLGEIAEPYRFFNTADTGAVEITIDAGGVSVVTARNTREETGGD